MEKTKRMLDVSARVECREASGKRFIEGLIPYNSMSEDLGGFVERIDPSAFKKTLNDGADVFAFWAHDSSEVLGSTKAKTMTLEDREDGLAFSIEIRDTAMGEDRFEAVKRGDVLGTSFGFITERDEWDHTAKPVIRVLKEVRLVEISPGVTWPAYPGAQSAAALRSLVAEVRSTQPPHPVSDIPPVPAPAPPESAPKDEDRAAMDEAKMAARIALAECGVHVN